VDDRRDRRIAFPHQAFDEVAVGDVTGDDPGIHVYRAGISADQYQVPCSVLGHEVTGDQRTDRAGPTGDQHRAGRVDRAARRRNRAGHAHCPRHPGADGQLRLSAAAHQRQDPIEREGAVEVDERDPRRVFGPGRQAQSPHRRGREIGIGAGGVPRDQHEPPVGLLPLV